MVNRCLLVLEHGNDMDAVIRTGASLACACRIELVLYTGLGRRCPPGSDLPNAVAAVQWGAMDDERLATERFHVQAREFALGLGIPSLSVIDTANDLMRSVVRTAQQYDCDLIVIAGEHHNAAVRMLNGSLIPGLISASPVPVMVCAHQPPRETAHRAASERIMILLGDDHTDAKPSVPGLDLARQLSADVRFVHVLPSCLAPVIDGPGLFLGGENRLTTAIDRQSRHILDSACQLAAEMGLTAHGASLPAGTPARHIAHLATGWACTLIVVEHHGDNALMRLLSGSPIPGLITVGELPVLICPTSELDSRGGAT